MSALNIVRRLARQARERVQRGGRLALAGICILVAAVCATVVGVVSFVPAAADNAIQGQAVDPATTETFMVAALSCPLLTGPRLAGTMMATTGMNFNATGGVAGLPSTVFAKWAPWSGASATDPGADTYALAHYLCSLDGQVRQARVGGDSWDDTVAAFHSGLSAVTKADGVPSDAQTFVNNVDGFAAWYAEQPGFTIAPIDAPDASADAAGESSHVLASTATPTVSDDYVSAIVAAGSRCPQITPAMVAAQLAASSGFDPNLRAATEAMGMAQFLPDMWEEFAPSVTSSPWDPATAIDVLGSTMCQLISQFSGIKGTPYEMALAAMRVGSTAVRQAGGVPAIDGVPQFISQVKSDTAVYQKDSRLTSSPSSAPSPGASPTPGASPGPSQPAGVTPSPSAPAGGASPSPSAPSSTAPKPKPSSTGGSSAPPSGPITGMQGLCIDDPSSSTTPGTQLQVWGCDDTAAQKWTVEADGTLRSMGMCMDVAFSGTANKTKVDLWPCNGQSNQQWRYRSDGTLYSPYSGKCLDADLQNYGWGSLLTIWTCNGGDNQQFKLPGS